eukprot:15079532-Alexandrium_andersonii.AAC.1
MGAIVEPPQSAARISPRAAAACIPVARAATSHTAATPLPACPGIRPTATSVCMIRTAVPRPAHLLRTSSMAPMASLAG